MKEIRIGLVGSGWMGKAHSSALADAEMLFGPDYGTASFEIVADANEEAAKSAQKKIGFKRISTDWHDVVTDPNVDLVDIATPNAFHYVVAKAALENGKNVYCEKPRRSMPGASVRSIRRARAHWNTAARKPSPHR